MARKPAQEIVAIIDRIMKRQSNELYNGGRAVPEAELQQIRTLAKSIDARMRLDGSKLNKRRTPAKAKG